MTQLAVRLTPPIHLHQAASSGVLAAFWAPRIPGHTAVRPALGGGSFTGSLASASTPGSGTSFGASTDGASSETSTSGTVVSSHRLQISGRQLLEG